MINIFPSSIIPSRKGKTAREVPVRANRFARAFAWVAPDMILIFWTAGLVLYQK
jgi:hypothetical protein